MGKNIFKEVPEGFHNQFMDTIDSIRAGEVKSKKRKVSSKKMILLLAAAVAALSTMTVGATALYKMHQTAAEQLGVDAQLADQLVQEGVAKEEQAQVQGEGLTIQALQTVYRENSIYLLLSVEVPDGVTVDGDTLFEGSNVISELPFSGCVVNSISDSIQGNTSLWEVELLLEAGQEYAGQEVVMQLTNLIQTHKTETTQLLVEGEWEIAVRLPQEAETSVYLCDKEVALGSHVLKLDRVEANPFGVQLYLEEEELQHSLQYQDIQLTAVRYGDGREVEEAMSVSHRQIQTNEETGEKYVHLMLQNAVDPEHLEALIFDEGKQEILLGQSSLAEGSQQEIVEKVIPEDLTALQLLHVKNGHAILHDSHFLYLWDADCGYMEVLMNLGALGYDEAQGGELAVGPGGNTVFVRPTGDSAQIYVGNVAYGLEATENAYDLTGEAGWPEQDFSNAQDYTLEVEAGELHLY